jgi:heat shock protein HslJ
MTDEQMDARLRTAGENWRAANAAPATATVEAAVTTPADSDIAAPPHRHRRAGWFASAALVAAALVVGGTFALTSWTDTSQHRAADTAGLKGTVWRMVGYGNNLDSRSDATLYIDPKGHLVADDECAVLGGTAQVQGDRITVPDLIIRNRSCTDSTPPTFAGHGTDILTAGGSFSIDGAGLTISAAGVHMHFVVAPKSTPAPTLDVPTLVGANWQLVGVTDAGGHEVTVPDRSTLRIDDNGRLTAQDGCNTFTGRVVYDGPQIEVKNVASTTNPCPNLAAPSVIDSVLSGSLRQLVIGGELTLTKPGAGKLTYRWVPADTAATGPKNLSFRNWTLESVAGEPSAGGLILYMSTSGAYSANDGCRFVGGNFTAGPGTIKYNGVPASKPGCGGTKGDQATTIDSFLATGGLWSIRDGKLILEGGGAQAFALVYGNQTPPPVSPVHSDLAGKDWTIASIDGQSLTDPAISLRIENGKLTGRDGCNYMGGQVKVDGNRLVTSEIAVTAMACTGNIDQTGPDQIMTRAGQIDQFFQGTLTWSVDNAVLTLNKPGAGKLTYRELPPKKAGTDPALLIGTWALSGIEHNTGNSGSASGSSNMANTTVAFDGGPHIVITHRCYVNRGDTVVGDGSMDISNVRLSSATPCPATPTQQDEQNQNGQVDNVLTGHVTWSIKDGGLSITKGQTTLTFSPKS